MENKCPSFEFLNYYSFNLISCLNMKLKRNNNNNELTAGVNRVNGFCGGINGFRIRGFDCLNCQQPEVIEVANQKWDSFYCDVDSSPKSAEKVQFSTEKIQIKTILVWDFASRKARTGEWEQMARDRQRFAERIRRTEATLKRVLLEKHRKQVYDERFANSKL